MIDKEKIKGMSLGLTATVIWGTFYPVSRMLFGYDDDGLEPLNYTLIRFILAIIFLSPVFLHKQTRSKTPQLLSRHWKLLLLLGIFGITGESVLVFSSLKYTTATRASLMANTSPIFTLLISRLAGREALSKGKIIGMLLGFAGILFIFTGNGQDMFAADKSTFLGDILALGSGICWSVYTVYGDELATEYGGTLTCAILFSIAALAMLPVVLFRNGTINFHLSAMEWYGAIYLGVISYGFANTVWYMALKHVSPGQLGSLGYISATMAAILSVFVIHEKITMSMLFAIVFVLSGVGLMVYSGKKKIP